MQMVPVWRLACQREIVLWPPEKILSTVTVEPQSQVHNSKLDWQDLPKLAARWFSQRTVHECVGLASAKIAQSQKRPHIPAVPIIEPSSLICSVGPLTFQLLAHKQPSIEHSSAATDVWYHWLHNGHATEMTIHWHELIPLRNMEEL